MGSLPQRALPVTLDLLEGWPKVLVSYHARTAVVSSVARRNFKGYFNAAIRVGDKTVNWNIYVIEGNAESLIGRDSSFKLAILTQVNSVGQNELDSLFKEYDDVF